MSSRTATVAIGLGSNLGDREGHLREAIRAFDDLFSELRVGELYESEALGHVTQPRYLNTAVVGRTHLAPEPLLAVLKFLEHSAGRRRGPRWGPRVLDLDLLLHGSEVRTSTALTLPHPELRRRSFVVAPLADAAPDLSLPPDGVTAGALAAQIDRHGLRRRGWTEPAVAALSSCAPGAPGSSRRGS